MGERILPPGGRRRVIDPWAGSRDLFLLALGLTSRPMRRGEQAANRQIANGDEAGGGDWRADQRV
jgi:hypothetical protein